MKVADLIALLQEEDQEAVVVWFRTAEEVENINTSETDEENRVYLSSEVY